MKIVLRAQHQLQSKTEATLYKQSKKTKEVKLQYTEKNERNSEKERENGYIYEGGGGGGTESCGLTPIEVVSLLLLLLEAEAEMLAKRLLGSSPNAKRVRARVRVRV